MVRINILLKSGTEGAYHAAGMMAVGAASVDTPVRIFIMDDALAGLLRTLKGERMPSGYRYKEMEEAVEKAESSGKFMSWEQLFESAKELGETEIIVCGLAADLLGVKEDDLPEYVDGISGVADFVGGMEDDDIVIAL